MIVISGPMLMGMLLAICLATIAWAAGRAAARLNAHGEGTRWLVRDLRTDMLKLSDECASLRTELDKMRALVEDKHPPSAFRAPPEAPLLPVADAVTEEQIVEEQIVEADIPVDVRPPLRQIALALLRRRR